MFQRVAPRFVSGARAASSAKVAVIGAGGGIGQPLSLLLKNNARVGNLALLDLVGTPGVAADLSHIPTPAQVSGFLSKDGKPAFENTLKDCDVVVIPAGVPRKPGMTRDDLFNSNAEVVLRLAKAVAELCPKAFVCVITNPVNSTVPIMAQTLTKAGCYDPKRLFGVTTLDLLRAETFYGGLVGANPLDVKMPVIGGHSGETIVPITSQATPAGSIADLAAFTKRVQFGGDEVVQAKDGAGSATLSMAAAADRFVASILRARDGEEVSEFAYVDHEGRISPRWFSTKIQIDSNGVKSAQELTGLTDYENKLLEVCKGDLEKNIAKGLAYADEKFDSVFPW